MGATAGGGGAGIWARGAGTGLHAAAVKRQGGGVRVGQDALAGLLCCQGRIGRARNGQSGPKDSTSRRNSRENLRLVIRWVGGRGRPRARLASQGGRTVRPTRDLVPGHGQSPPTSTAAMDKLPTAIAVTNVPSTCMVWPGAAGLDWPSTTTCRPAASCNTKPP